MKRIFSVFLVLFVSNTAFCDQSFFLGIEGGAAYTGGILDYDTDAVYQFEKNTLELEGTFQTEPEIMLLNPAFSLTLGFGLGNRVSFRTGADFFVGAQEKFLIFIDNTTQYYCGLVEYKYSFINVPFLFDFFFVNGKRFRMGLSLGPYFSIPLGDIERNISDSNLFTKKGATKKSFNVHDTIPQRFNAGLQAGLTNEVLIKNFAITLNINFSRQFFNGIEALFLGNMPEEWEPKISILQAVRVTVGAKYYFKFKNDKIVEKTVEVVEIPAPEPEPVAEVIVEAPPETAPQTAYYIIVGTQAEGPLQIKDLKRLAVQGMFKVNTPVWSKDMADWQAAGDVEELREVFWGLGN